MLRLKAIGLGIDLRPGPFAGLWELWLEGEDPSWIEVHRQKRLED